MYIGFTFANLFCIFALYKIRAKARSNLLIILTVLLIISNTASCLWQYSDYNYNLEKCTPGPNLSDSLYRKSVIGIAICGPLAVALTTYIHWQFAYKYWELSFRVESIFRRETHLDLSRQMSANRVVLFNIFFWPALSTLMFPIVKLVQANLFMTSLYYIGLWTQLIIDPLSCYVLWSAFRRIRAFSVSQNLIINKPMMIRHFISYVLFMFSMLLYLFVYAS